MLLSFIKKELLLLIRNPQELLVLVAMPFILIIILGFALGSVLNGEGQVIEGKVGLVMHSNDEEELTKFKEDLEKLPIPVEMKEQLLQQAEHVLPIPMLADTIFGSDELRSVMTLEELPIDQFQAAKKEGEYSAIIEVPEQFTSQLLYSAFIEQTDVPALMIYSNEGKELSASIVEDVITVFQEQYTLSAMLGKELQSEEVISVPNVKGSIETVANREPISAFNYYAVGMGVMFVLFIASTISARTFIEKKEHLFDRILLANVPSWTYLGSVFFSAIVIALLQLGILFGGAALFFKVYWPNFLSFLCVTISLCVAVAGITVLLTALNHYFNTDVASKLFMTSFVAVLSFVGGSFVPVMTMSEVLEQVGQYTPNGAAMSAYLNIFQGAGVTEVIDHITVLLLFTTIVSAIAWFVFSRKGVAV
ncbi:ABC transporter permease [Bacillus sp. FJAT-50079]|uniref:ABC transporter permease n=1 Tax=Bacillus sp. FJAT-50079 TaxID=2833577 RepID=UPI0020167446|nr:ABC transporter permease [Bacillus sp. FJAT-50079]